MQNRNDNYIEVKNNILSEAKGFMIDEELSVLSQVLDKTINEMGVSVFRK